MAAALQRKCSGGIIFVIITKIITKIIVPRIFFVIISARMVVFFRVCSFNVHAPYILSADDLGDFSGIL